MDERSDQQLLRDYQAGRSEEAFAELVRRHVDHLYSAALRMVCDAHLAEDVTQSTFLALARKAADLADRPVLSGWLHRTAQNLAAKTVRSDVRRRVREREVAIMNELLVAESEGVWKQVAPHLDAALGDLNDPDRDALLLRFFERKSAREMAQALRITDEAAQKRVTRAVERLRQGLEKRGVCVGATGLTVAVSAHAVQTAPVALAGTISTTIALSGASWITATNITTTTAQKILITASVLLLGAATPWVLQHRSHVRLREENESLRQQVGRLEHIATENERLSKQVALAKNSQVPRLPAPPVQRGSGSVDLSADEREAARRIAQLLQEDQARRLTVDQIKPYLDQNHRSAASLLAAFRATGDLALLREAMDKFPSDPQVNFAASTRKDVSPEDRRRGLDAFKQAAPENALANYLSALDYFKSGQTDLAVRELAAASGKSEFKDYTLEFMQENDDAWRTSGYPLTEAKIIATTSQELPQLAQLKELTQDTVALANSYRQAGDESSAQMVLQMGADLGQRFGGLKGEPLVSRLVGVAIEQIALHAMDPNSPYGAGGGTVSDRINELTQQRSAIRDLTSHFGTVQASMSSQDWISYIDRWRAFGEQAAIQWMVDKHGHP
ncbi:MAG TPA: sigma-70 family RNA polymerase sigma factor [Candidatus Limnocylindria bacterium]|nr:sigma-70 family RNA polymerase sigma factor [Candidatus Limnocylindria bacterium]